MKDAAGKARFGPWPIMALEADLTPIADLIGIACEDASQRASLESS